jgi:hypothetical protein
LSNIKGYQINLPKDVIVYTGVPMTQLEKMYETYYVTMQTDPKVVITSGEIDQIENPENGLKLLNDLFNNDDFVNFVNDLIDNFEGAEIIIDDDDEILEIENKEDGLKDYMFSISIENDTYDTYFTEKILDCFATGTIPIYKGTKKIVEHFNSEGIIFLDDINIDKLSPELYYSYMDAIKDNFERVKKLYTLDDWIYNKYLINYV